MTEIKFVCDDHDLRKLFKSIISMDLKVFFSSWLLEPNLKKFSESDLLSNEKMLGEFHILLPFREDLDLELRPFVPNGSDFIKYYINQRVGPPHIILSTSLIQNAIQNNQLFRIYLNIYSRYWDRNQECEYQTPREARDIFLTICKTLKTHAQRKFYDIDYFWVTENARRKIPFIVSE